jgi:hypothetical protein
MTANDCGVWMDGCAIKSNQNALRSILLKQGSLLDFQ